MDMHSPGLIASQGKSRSETHEVDCLTVLTQTR